MTSFHDPGYRQLFTRSLLNDGYLAWAHSRCLQADFCVDVPSGDSLPRQRHRRKNICWRIVFLFSPHQTTLQSKNFSYKILTQLYCWINIKKMNEATEKKCMNLGIVAADQVSFICESKSEMTPDVIILESKWADQIFPGTAHGLRHSKMLFNDTTHSH